MLTVVSDDDAELDENQLLAEILQRCREVSIKRVDKESVELVEVKVKDLVKKTVNVKDPVEKTVEVENKWKVKDLVEIPEVQELAQEPVREPLKEITKGSAIGIAIGIIAKDRSDKAKREKNPAKPPLPYHRPPDVVTLSGVGSLTVSSGNISQSFSELLQKQEGDIPQCETMLKPRPHTLSEADSKGAESDDAKALLMVRWHSQDLGDTSEQDDETTESTESLRCKEW